MPKMQFRARREQLGMMGITLSQPCLTVLLALAAVVSQQRNLYVPSILDLKSCG